MSFINSLKHAWNAFTGKDLYEYQLIDTGPGNSIRPDRVAVSYGRERSLITAVYNRIALDCSQVQLEHVKLDEHGRYLETMASDLNERLTFEANKDQTGAAIVHDIVMSMFEEGVVAVCPTETSIDPNKGDSYKINSMRTAKIVEWYPNYVKVRIYDDITAQFVERIYKKSAVAIIENPFAPIMNEPNSTVNRLNRKLALMDAIDEQSGAGKLDLIIQLPYVIKGEARKKQAEIRRKELETQLAGSKYGIAYTDGTEHVTQLNRPLENNLMKQIEYLTNLAYSQLGITTSIMDGSADEKTMTNYRYRIISLIMDTIARELCRKFLTKTARSQRQSITYFQDPFTLVAPTQLADIADKFTRNEILSSNEIRQMIGRKPSQDPQADELRNKNLNKQSGQVPPTTKEEGPEEKIDNTNANLNEGENQNGV